MTAPQVDELDELLLTGWAGFLAAAGWSAASVKRATNRLRALARVSQAGLVHATQHDVIALAQRCRKATGRDLEGLLRSESWRQSIRAIRSFYRWTKNRGFIGVASDPTLGILEVPGRPPGVRVRLRDGRLYEAMLNTPLSPRDQAILSLLALGCAPQEVAALTLEDLHLPDRFLRTSSKAPRTVPLSETAAERLTRWLSWRSMSAAAFLFPGPVAGRPLTSSAVRAVVRHAARRAFPRPDQHALRRRIYPTGLRHLFLMRVICARVAPAFVRGLTGLDRLSEVERYARATRRRSPETVLLVREIRRMARRWPDWI